MDRTLRKVTQLNIRLSEGGAAGVARTLAAGLEVSGICSAFVYGYGPRGLDSPLETSFLTSRVTPKPLAYANVASHRLIGEELAIFDNKRWKVAKEILASSDVIHVHAMHSFYLNPYTLMDELGKLGRPVVWTQHDQWALTGRCALPGSCRKFVDGCGKCPNMKAYPEGILDHSSRIWHKRRASISRLADSVPLSIVACADWLGHELISEGMPNVSVIKNTPDDEFISATRRPPEPTREIIRVLFLARDLRDENKVDWPLLEAVARIPQVQLTLVGDHAPKTLPGTTQVPATSDRRQLADLMSSHDRLIFTSTNETYPLTIVEALATEMEVFAIDSRATREFENDSRVRLFRDGHFLVEEITAPLSSRQSHSPTSTTSMVDQYIKLYRSLVEQQ